MAKVLNLVDIQGSDVQSKRPASSTVDVPVPKRLAMSRMPIHKEESSPHVSVYNSLCI